MRVDLLVVGVVGADEDGGADGAVQEVWRGDGVEVGEDVAGGVAGEAPVHDVAAALEVVGKSVGYIL